MAIVINDSNFDELVSKSDKPVMLDFWAEWCGPCRAIAPSVDAIAEEYADRAVVGKVNVDESTELTSKFGITNIPTMLYFKEGKLVDKQIGSATRTVLAGKLNALL